MNNSKYLEQNIQRLDLEVRILDLLKSKGITKIKELCNMTKTKLKEMGINQKEIEKIQIELQLLGLDLKER